MKISIEKIEKMIETLSPVRFACDWDNSGFHINLGRDISKILVCLDVSEEIIQEAVEKECELIVSHHPLFFKEIRSIDFQTYPGRMAAEMIQNGISLYCAHTSMDSAPEGINTFLAELLGLGNVRFFEPATQKGYNQIGVYVPAEYADKVAEAMGEAGAGMIGNYRDCAFFAKGEGRFRPNDKANPFIGEAEKLEKVAEVKIEAICAEDLTERVVHSMKEVHPYEEVAYYVTGLKNNRETESGLGVTGDFARTITLEQAARLVKESLKVDTIRVMGDLEKPVKKVGICGGGGGEMVPYAEKMGVDLFITGEVKHNIYVAAKKVSIIEAGHFDTEKCFVGCFAQGLQKRADALKYTLDIIESEHVARPFINF
jgi:dinuclear metal center YbgI/SA1388 family protein